MPPVITCNLLPSLHSASFSSAERTKNARQLLLSSSSISSSPLVVGLINGRASPRQSQKRPVRTPQHTRPQVQYIETKKPGDPCTPSSSKPQAWWTRYGTVWVMVHKSRIRSVPITGHPPFLSTFSAPFHLVSSKTLEKPATTNA